MTDDEINRAIAEILEPILPTEPLLDCVYFSPKRAWRWAFPDPLAAWHWEPIDFLHSEDASAMLLDAMPFMVLRRENTPTTDGLGPWNIGIQAQPKKRLPPIWYGHDPDRKRAVRDAFCRLHGVDIARKESNA